MRTVTRFDALPFVLSRVLTKRLMTYVLRRHPRLFERMGEADAARILIEPVELPFAILLIPQRAKPKLLLCRRSDPPAADAKVRGTFLKLFSLVEGEVDGDALFFSRDLSVTGNTEAVVCLRNCLDDLDEPITHDIADFFGPPGRRILEYLKDAERFAARTA